eukprot:Clim_evm20s215 gene=Clim_evmTU20s215
MSVNFRLRQLMHACVLVSLGIVLGMLWTESLSLSHPDVAFTYETMRFDPVLAKTVDVSDRQICKAHAHDKLITRFTDKAMSSTRPPIRRPPVHRPTRPGDDTIWVHMVPHTHDDVGWLKTVDQYYYGANQPTARASVHWILDTVVEELWKDPDRRFTYVEMAFFYRWWSEQDGETRSRVAKLVREGRLEFLNAGWSMNDEASVYYQDTIDQMTLGHRLIFGEFGAVPTVAWSIDPFGHSQEQASLFARMGFDAIFFGRIDYQDKMKRDNERSLEMIWHGSKSIGEEADLFTGVLYNHYGPPAGFNAGWNDPIMDNPELDGYNLPDMIDMYINAAYEYANHMATNQVMFTMGGDFNYENAHVNFQQMEKIMGHINEMQEFKGKKVRAFYSTPSQYVEALHTANITWPTKSDDFFPYADRPTAYWTGYFTSRANLKGYVRSSNAVLQACRHFEYLSVPFPKKDDDDSPAQFDGLSLHLAEELGILQHHDAVSGTEKQFVADDYANRLTRGRRICHGFMTKALEDSLGSGRMPFDTSNVEQPPPPDQTYHTCDMLNVTSCAVTESSDDFHVVVYNPLAHYRVAYVTIPVDGFYMSRSDGHVDRKAQANSAYRVWDAVSMHPMEHSILPSPRLPVDAGPAINGPALPQPAPSVITVPVLIAPFGFRIINVESTLPPPLPTPPPSHRPIGVERTEGVSSANSDIDNVENEQFKLVFDEDTGFLDAVCIKSVTSEEELHTGCHHHESCPCPAGSQYLRVSQDWRFYESNSGGTSDLRNTGQASGAYIFRPKDTEEPESFRRLRHLSSKPVPTEVFRIPLAKGKAPPNDHDQEAHFIIEVHQEITSWITQVIRLYPGDMPLARAIEIESTIGQVPVSDGTGREVVMHFHTGIDSGDTFYTDANGREMKKRVRNHRDTWNLTVTEPVSGNYYPVNTRISLRDDVHEFVLLTDRSVGGSSLGSGELEVMLQRRTLHDDARGVSEPLDEKIPVAGDHNSEIGIITRSKQWITVQPVASSAELHRPLALEIAHPVSTFFAKGKYEPTTPDPPQVHMNTVLLGNQGLAVDGDESALFDPSKYPILDVLSGKVDIRASLIPDQLHLLTLERLDHSWVLLRLEHIFEAHESDAGSTAAAVDLQHLFGHKLAIEDVIEVGLSGLPRRHRRKFVPQDQYDNNNQPEDLEFSAPLSHVNGTLVTLGPMEISTLYVKLRTASG